MKGVNIRTAYVLMASTHEDAEPLWTVGVVFDEARARKIVDEMNYEAKSRWEKAGIDEKIREAYPEGWNKYLPQIEHPPYTGLIFWYLESQELT